MNTPKPEHTPDEKIAALCGDTEWKRAEAIVKAMDRVDELMRPKVNAETILGNRPVSTIPLRDGDTHQVSAWLYRKFKPGSAILSKDDAYKLGNLIETQQLELAKAHETIQRLMSEIAGMVR